jgi:hypothetical protein
MKPSFNTAGPCVAGEHYMLSPSGRLGQVPRLIDEGKYFTVHAGRQTGKTTNARWLAKTLNAGDRYCAVWVDIQAAREEPEPAAAFRTILNKFEMALAIDLPSLTRPDTTALLADPATALLKYIAAICSQAPRPLVILFDEADGLVGRTVVSFLTQLRDGYVNRSTAPFPHSLALIGMRQVRDFVISTEERREVAWLGTTSPFNITAEAVTLEPFSRDDVADLLGQHTEHTGQRFGDEAVEHVYHLSQGHPWLVNALADQVVNRDVEDRSVTVTAAHVEAAKETIITERRTHIDSLIARLREPRVRKIMEPMLVGGQVSDDVLDDDFAYVKSLGLIVTHGGRCEIANPIYREIVPRALTYTKQFGIAHETSWYVRGDGSLDVPKLLAAWQTFWREDGHLAAAGFLYREAGPHIMLMAFLQRVVNGGGRVEREYGLGRGALDLMLFWRSERYAVEVKLRRDTRTLERGVRQTASYLDASGLDEGWLVLFDLRAEPTWEEKLFLRDERVGNTLIHVVGC